MGTRVPVFRDAISRAKLQVRFRNRLTYFHAFPIIANRPRQISHTPLKDRRPRYGIEQRARVRMARALKGLLHRSGLDDPAALQDGHPLARTRITVRPVQDRRVPQDCTVLPD